MSQQNHLVKKTLEQRVISAAEQVLSKQNYVRPIDVMITLGWLQQVHAKDWQEA